MAGALRKGSTSVRASRAPSSAMTPTAAIIMAEQQDERRTHARVREPDPGRQRRECAQHHHVAVGELDHVQHAEEEGEADGDQRVDHAQHQAVEDVLREQDRVHGQLLLGQRPLAARVLAVLPHDPLAVLDDELRDQRHRVLAVVVEGDLADDGIVVARAIELGAHLLAVRARLSRSRPSPASRRRRRRGHRLPDRPDTSASRMLEEHATAGQLLRRRTFAERDHALRERTQAFGEGIGHDARGALEHGLHAELVHLAADAHAERGQAGEVDHLGLELLDLGELGGEVLLVGGDAEGAEDLAAVLREVFAEVLVVALAVVGGVVDDRPALELELGHELRRRLVLVDHRAVDAMHLLVVVRVGDVRQHCAPHHDRQAELAIDVHGGHRDGGAVVRHARR